jgi:hypothetical protein
MKDYNEITREEFYKFKHIKAQIEFTQNEMMGIVNLSRLYVNRFTPSCISCSNSFRETINGVRSFYLQHKDEWEKILAEKENPTPTPKKNVKSK